MMDLNLCISYLQAIVLTPFVSLRVQEVMPLQTQCLNMPSMTRNIHQDFNKHDSPL
jgi:hypothetical protein